MFKKRARKEKVISYADEGDICITRKKTKKPELPEVPEPVPPGYKGSKGMNMLKDIATRSSEIDTEQSNDNHSQVLRNLEISKQIHKGELDPQVYRGLHGYALYAEKSATNLASSKTTGSLGPVRAPANIRSICRFDYSYGLCKDWKVSGYCGYGDNCIFMHDRSEFKTGWELEKEWETAQQQKRAKRPEETVTQRHPKECGVCGKIDEDTIFTVCRHPFCYPCALQSPVSCRTCGCATNGLFNSN